MSSKQFGEYSIKNLKTFRGREGQGYNATLYSGTQKIADIIDQGDGGAPHIQFLNTNADNARRDELALHNFIDLQTGKRSPHRVGGVSMKLEQFLGGLVDRYETERKFRRMCKSQTLFRLNGDEDGTFRRIAAPYTAAVKQFINQKYGDKVQAILNEDPTYASGQKAPSRNTAADVTPACGETIDPS